MSKPKRLQDGPERTIDVQRKARRDFLLIAVVVVVACAFEFPACGPSCMRSNVSFTFACVNEGGSKPPRDTEKKES
jgi:hypothetical protein